MQMRSWAEGAGSEACPGSGPQPPTPVPPSHKLGPTPSPPPPKNTPDSGMLRCCFVTMTTLLCVQKQNNLQTIACLCERWRRILCVSFPVSVPTSKAGRVSRSRARLGGCSDGGEMLLRPEAGSCPPPDWRRGLILLLLAQKAALATPAPTQAAHMKPRLSLSASWPEAGLAQHKS